MTRQSFLPTGLFIVFTFLFQACSEQVLVELPEDFSNLDVPSRAEIILLMGNYDRDRDGLTDDIDPCPDTKLNDQDRDGVCEEILSDMNEDGCVDYEDVAIIRAEYGQRGEGLRADLIPDGVVNLSDLGLFGLENGDCRDNCPEVSNEYQEDGDGNGIGDACEDGGGSCTANFCQNNGLYDGYFCDGNDSVQCTSDTNGCFHEELRSPCTIGCYEGGADQGRCSRDEVDSNAPQISFVIGTASDGNALTIYGVQFGDTQGTGGAVLLSNQPYLPDAKQIEEQQVQTWASTQIKFMLKQGSFDLNKPAYVIVKRSDGTIGAGYQINIR